MANNRGMLESLQQQDSKIDSIVAYNKFVVAYLLQQDGPNPGWRKANIEGPVYLVRRRTAPRFQLLVKNQFSTNDLLDNLHPDWELDCQKNYVFYKVEDSSKRIRGLWFHDDAERMKLEGMLEKTLEDVRKGPPQEPEQQLSHSQMPHNMPPAQKAHAGNVDPGDSLYSQFGGVQKATGDGQAPQVPVSKQTLSAALHNLADDDNFVDMVMRKLKEAESKR